jgi:hypothetical protein
MNVGHFEFVPLLHYDPDVDGGAQQLRFEESPKSLSSQSKPE